MFEVAGVLVMSTTAAPASWNGVRVGGRPLNVLVTGHRGFLGSVLVSSLIESGHDVVGVDAGWFRPGVQQDAYDLTTRDLEAYDAVVHLAGFSDDQLAAAHPDAARASNTYQTAAFAGRCAAAGVGRFILASSAAVYGSSPYPVSEVADTTPLSVYSASKLAAEAAIEALARPGFTPVVLRFGSGFGWSPAPRFDLLVNKLTLVGLREGRIGLHSDGSSHRPFVHVVDMARAVAHVLKADLGGEGPHRFNVVHPEGNRTAGEVVELVAAAVGAVLDPPGRLRDARDYQLDPTALLATGFGFRWPLERGITSLARHLRHEGTEDPAPWDRVARLDPRLVVDVGAEGPGSRRHIPLVSPALLDLGANQAFLGEVATITETSRYRVTGGATDRAGELVGAAFDLAAHQRALLLRSGTDALTRALQLSGVDAGDRVVVPDHAFHAVVATVRSIGAVPVFADIDPFDFNVTPDAVARLLAGNDRVAAVVAVDNYGTPADWAGLARVCRAAAVPLVVDACESLGSSRPDASVAACADLVAVSFSFTKPVHAAGMGGALLGPIDRLDELAAEPGWLVRQAMLPELNAAYLVRAWPDLPRNLQRLRAHYEVYRRELEPLGFMAQGERGFSTRIHAPFLLPVGSPWSRDAFLAALADEGVGAAAQFPSQSRLFGLNADCPVSADVDARVVSLPSGAGLAPELAKQAAITAARAYVAR